MNKVNIDVFNSFTLNGKGGNPAGVVLTEETLDFAKMQKIAAFINLSETVFIGILSENTYHLRFFTPLTEVEFCGHATIAAMEFLKRKFDLEDGVYYIESLKGNSVVRINESDIYLAMPDASLEEIIPESSINEIFQNSVKISNNLPVQVAISGLRDIIIPLVKETDLASLRPDFSAISLLSKKHNSVGIHVFTIIQKNDKKIEVACRNFAPLVGISEESATGTANGALALFLYNHLKLVEDVEFLCYQGQYMNKPSLIKVRISDKFDKPEITVGGKAEYVCHKEWCPN
ncbi:MAG: PhzF family phenazine biosynthesis protein [Candidatus Cloacimonetes bacterium]|nr:PhzF family phenazine biosynthesis protein [Candidatus Cloacimonadota bacterium]